MSNSFGSEGTLRVGEQTYLIHRLTTVEKAIPSAGRLPYSLKILLENLLRTENGQIVRAGDIEALARWDAKAETHREIAFTPTTTHEVGVVHPEIGGDALEGDVSKTAAVKHVLHVPSPRSIELMEQRILSSIKFKWPQSDPITQARIEGRRCLYPFACEVKFRVRVPTEHIRLHQFTQSRRG